MSSTRQELINALILQIRLVTANSVLFSQIVSDKVGLHSTDNECLDFLMINGPATAGQLAKRTGLTTGAITATIDRLEKAGFAKREQDPQDRRKVIVVPNMEKIEAEIMPHMMAMGQAMAAFCEGFSDDELATIQQFLGGANSLATDIIAQAKE
jgi:DNA-binding MarR family transcriptional regulator